MGQGSGPAAGALAPPEALRACLRRGTRAEELPRPQPSRARGLVCLRSWASVFGLPCLTKLDLVLSQTAGVCSATEQHQKVAGGRLQARGRRGRPRIPDGR